MIAHRFRPVAWVAGVAVAATALYLVSLQVASERGRLEKIDRQIARTEREIRQLQTELNTRASMRQLEKWNVEALALASPKAAQFLSDEAELANVDPTNLKRDHDVLPPIMVAAATNAPQPAGGEVTAVPEKPVATPASPAPIVARSNKVALLDKALLPIAAIQPKAKIQQQAAKGSVKAQ